MNKKLASKLCVLAMFITALIPTNASAYGQKWDYGRDWQLLNASGYSNNSYGVATSDDGQIVYTVGPTGVTASYDSGATWISRSTGLTISGVGFAGIATNADGSILSVVQNGGSIFVSSNYGVTWTEKTNVTTSYGSGMEGWLAVAMSDSGQYIITAAHGMLWRSTDFGATFTQKIIDSNVPGNSDEIYVIGISGNGQRIIVPTSHYGKVYLSLNYGASFSAMSGLPNVGWSAAGISGDGNTLIAAAYLQNIWVSHDAGSTWKETTVDVLSPPNRNWGQVTLSYDGQIIGMTRYGYKLLTSDTAGDSWEVKPKSYSQMWKSITSSRDGKVIYAGAILDHGSGGVYKSIPTYIYTDYGMVTLLLDPCWDSENYTSVRAASVVLMADTASAIAQGDASTYTYFSETDTALWGADYNYGSVQDKNTCLENPMNGTVTLSRGRFMSSTNSVVLSETTTNTTDFLQYIGNTVYEEVDPRFGNTWSYVGLPCGNMNASPRNTTNVTTSCTAAIQADYTLLTYTTPVQIRDSNVKAGVLGQPSGKIYTFVKVLNSIISQAPIANKWVATETYTVTSS
jgi:photosystem II stability/assembly factor-like uncharacterized protein